MPHGRKTVAALSMAAALGSMAVWGLTLPAPATADAAQPDLTIDAARLQASVDIRTKVITSSDCAYKEGCVRGTGKRTLMRFDVAIPNIGTADLKMGDPRQNPSLFEFSPCHGHYHLIGFADYVLLDAGDSQVVTGRKQAFCLEDFQKYDVNAGPAKFTCSNQGISMGWADVYGKYLDCQWIDITGVPGGTYKLRVTINATGLLGESNYANNVATVPVTIPSRFGN